MHSPKPELHLPRWEMLDNNAAAITAQDLLDRLGTGNCLVYQVLNEAGVDYINTLLAAKTPYGKGLLDLIASGLHRPACHIGIYVDGSETYTDPVFGDFLKRIIVKYHNVDVDNKEHREDFETANLNLVDLNETKTELCEVLSMRVRYAFTTGDRPFQSAMTPEQRKEDELRIVAALQTLPADLQGTYESLETMTPERRQQLVDEHFLSRTECDEDLVNANVTADFPNARGIFLSHDKEIFVLVNDEDNRVGVLKQGGDIKATFEKLATVSNILNAALPMARTANYGKLASCPTNIGTGMRLSGMVTFPVLAREYEADLKEIAKRYGLAVRGFFGENSGVGGRGETDISNKARLGISEAQIAQQVNDGILFLMDLETKVASEQDPVQRRAIIDAAKNGTSS